MLNLPKPSFCAELSEIVSFGQVEAKNLAWVRDPLKRCQKGDSKKWCQSAVSKLTPVGFVLKNFNF